MTEDSLVVESDVMVAMRDGVRLRADVFRPAGDGTYPVLVQRYPYSTRDGIMAMFGRQIARQGYAVVVQSCRGRFGSEGEFSPFHPDVDDGYDTIEWAAAQPWSNGKVGMYGVSYSGMTQWAAAMARPPHLVCIAPSMCTWDWTIGGWYFSPGVLALGLALVWTAQMTAFEAERRGVALPPPLEPFAEAASIMDSGGLGDPAAMARLMEIQRDAAAGLLARRPLSDLDELRELAPWFQDWCDRPDPADEYWQRISGPAHADRLDLPVLHVTGWFDYFTKGSLHAYSSLAARHGQRLVVGQWNHNGFPYRPDGDPSAWMFFDFTPGTPLMRFFDHHLKGELPEYADEPPVRLYVTGENVWRDEREWPLARTVWTPYHLRTGGRLDRVAPGDEPADALTADPANPLIGPIAIGSTFDDRPDLAAASQRSDVLVFETDRTERDAEVTGPLRLEVWISSTAPSADICARLIEVNFDGTMVLLSQGVTRVSNGLDEPQRVEVDLGATSVLLRPGHRLRLQVAATDFPTFEPNPGTGNRITDDDRVTTSTHTVFHDVDRPSRLIVPVIPR